MKVAEKVILLLNGGDGLSAAITSGLLLNPTSNFQTIHNSFEFSLESYGIKDRKASGRIIHFINSGGHYEVSILILQDYSPPTLACAMHKVLLELAEGDSSATPKLLVPFVVPESKLKQEKKYSGKSEKVSVYGIKLGPTTDATDALCSRLHEWPPSLRIYHEELAVLLHLVNVMKIATAVLIGLTEQHTSNKSSREELEVISQIGEHLASVSSLSFSKEKMVQNPTKTSRDSEESWRALYG